MDRKRLLPTIQVFHLCRRKTYPTILLLDGTPEEIPKSWLPDDTGVALLIKYSSNQKGYQSILVPGHRLAQSKGYVYEHRFVMYEKYGEDLPDCELCGATCNWDLYTTHIDHIDEDVTNNDESNLRPLCNACNTSRGRLEPKYRSNAVVLEFKGEEKTVGEWVNDSRVVVSGTCIKDRIRRGMSTEDALFSKRLTHTKRES